MSVRFVVDEQGNPEEVLMDMQNYERLLDAAEDTETLELIRTMKRQDLTEVAARDVLNPPDESVATHDVFLDSRAAEQLRTLPERARQQLSEEVQALAGNPRPAESRKVVGSEGVLRLNDGDYRIIYEIDDSASRVVVYAVGHRQEIYPHQ
jgi:mRNA interferase RelE/StbE